MLTRSTIRLGKRLGRANKSFLVDRKEWFGAARLVRWAGDGGIDRSVAGSGGRGESRKGKRRAAGKGDGGERGIVGAARHAGMNLYNALAIQTSTVLSSLETVSGGGERRHRNRRRRPPAPNAALMEAVRWRNLAGAELLLTKGRCNDKDRQLRFSIAIGRAGSGPPEMVKLYSPRRIGPNFPATRKTPLHEALLAGHGRYPRILIEAARGRISCPIVGLGKADKARAETGGGSMLAAARTAWRGCRWTMRRPMGSWRSRASSWKAAFRPSTMR